MFPRINLNNHSYDNVTAEWMVGSCVQIPMQLGEILVYTYILGPQKSFENSRMITRKGLNFETCCLRVMNNTVVHWLKCEGSKMILVARERHAAC